MTIYESQNKRRKSNELVRKITGGKVEPKNYAKQDQSMVQRSSVGRAKGGAPTIEQIKKSKAAAQAMRSTNGQSMVRKSSAGRPKSGGTTAGKAMMKKTRKKIEK